jgi:hypothetical protein
LHTVSLPTCVRVYVFPCMPVYLCACLPTKTPATPSAPCPISARGCRASLRRY